MCLDSDEPVPPSDEGATNSAREQQAEPHRPKEASQTAPPVLNHDESGAFQEVAPEPKTDGASQPTQAEPHRPKEASQTAPPVLNHDESGAFQEVAPEPKTDGASQPTPITKQTTPQISQAKPYEELTASHLPPQTTTEKNFGILTAAEILTFIRNNELVENALEDNVQGCSYDLRIGTIFKDGRIIKGKQGAGDQVLLYPSEIVSLFTLEDLKLPNNICATAFAINSLSSQGLLVLNPGHVDPGYHGPLTVRVINLRYTPKSIDLGSPIFTVIFERLPETYPYKHNTPREEAEMRYNALDVEQNPKSLGKLVMLGKERPLMTGDEVDKRILRFWMSWVVFVASIVAAVFAVIAAMRSQQPIVVTPPAPRSEMVAPSPMASPTVERPINSPSPSRGDRPDSPKPLPNQRG